MSGFVGIAVVMSNPNLGAHRGQTRFLFFAPNLFGGLVGETQVRLALSVCTLDTTVLPIDAFAVRPINAQGAKLGRTWRPCHALSRTAVQPVFDLLG